MRALVVDDPSDISEDIVNSIYDIIFYNNFSNFDQIIVINNDNFSISKNYLLNFNKLCNI